MSQSIFKSLLLLLAVGFTAAFCVIVVPALLESGDVVGAFAAGFVNPFASGYSTDVLMCWAVLAVWVIYDATNHNIKHGWIALVLGVVPGVATGFALYLLIRVRQGHA